MTRCFGLVPAASLYVAQKLMAGSVSAAAAVSRRTTTGLACTRERRCCCLVLGRGNAQGSCAVAAGAHQVVGEAAAGGYGRVAQAQRAGLECELARRTGRRRRDCRQRAQHAHSRRVEDKVARRMARQQRAPAPAGRSRLAGAAAAAAGTGWLLSAGARCSVKNAGLAPSPPSGSVWPL